jgi:ABC-2 type transport system permease protein
MLPIIFGVPIVQLLILVNAATMDMKKIDCVIIDKDLSGLSRQLLHKFISSPFFHIVKTTYSSKEADELMLKNKADLIIYIPENFEKKIYNNHETDVQLQIDAINGLSAGLINAYSNSIINNFNKEILKETGLNTNSVVIVKNIYIEYSFWYNQALVFKNFMVPGILVILVTIMGVFLTALNLVREKEIGTIEQINVTPIKKYQFIISKLLPTLVIALFELAFGLGLGKLLYNIPVEGSLLVLFSFALVYLITALGFGLFLSAISHTQQQVMFMAFFFMITFILMSGIFTPAESMPQWAQEINRLNPVAYFMRVIRMIILKGSGFRHIWQDFVYMTIFGISILGLAIWRYRKVS